MESAATIRAAIPQRAKRDMEMSREFLLGKTKCPAHGLHRMTFT
jgi:hypothetical protein